ncbi:MAG: hypothetical protein J0I47_02065 [Sphingomonas sp.]|uniref:hypothetical protein n=1 Tax=Sphingomonas sp. TaxID=28214 RepID=UPI001AC73351|nr:hypothetical protein [Sphingomonas sp.]MBN8807014.1 hypothetical protein [Sphingomonas sp.]
MMKLAIFATAVATMTTMASADTGRTMRVATDIQSNETIVRVAPRDGGAYIELAQAYRSAGRTTDAATAYRAALARDNEMMMTPTGDAVWSHDIARRALVRLPQMAAR